MLNWEERRQLVKVAHLYYTDGWTQQEIAKAQCLKTSHFKALTKSKRCRNR